MPALLTRISSPPKAATVLSTEALTAATSALSAWIATAFRPVALMASTIFAALSADFS
jgi:hypothetical protein